MTRSGFHANEKVEKLKASDGSVLGNFTVGSNAYGIAFDGANMWVANESSNTVMKLAQAGTEVPQNTYFHINCGEKLDRFRLSGIVAPVSQLAQKEVQRSRSPSLSGLVCRNPSRASQAANLPL